MKIRKVYENINFSKDWIKDFFKEKEEIKNKCSDIKKLLLEYLLNNKILPERLNEDDIQSFNVSDFEFIKGKFIIYVSWSKVYRAGIRGTTDIIEFTPEQYEDFLNFGKNPDIHKSAKNITYEIY